LRLKLRVTPRSRTRGIAGWRPDGALHVRVTAAPEDGKANEAVLEILREALGLPRSAARLVGGASSREKWVELDGIDEAEVKRKLGL